MEHMDNERTANLNMGPSEESSPRRSMKMGRTLAALNTERISPYSVLRNTDEAGVQTAIKKLEE